MPSGYDIIESASEPGVFVLTLPLGGRPVVVMDAHLFRGLEAAIRDVSSRPGVRGFVIASEGTRAFVAGADLAAIHDLDADALDAYLAEGQRVMGMLPRLPFPVAAAVDGAVLGGGLELALHCDVVVGSELGHAKPSEDASAARPFKVGLPETTLGLCPGWGGSLLLSRKLGRDAETCADAIGMVMRGVVFGSDRAGELGLFDTTVPSAGDVVDEAVRTVAAMSDSFVRTGDAPAAWRAAGDEVVSAGLERALAGADTEEAKAVAACVHAGLGGGWFTGLDMERSELVRLSRRDEARGKIAGFLKR